MKTEKINGYTLITGATSSIGADVARKRSVTDNLILHGRDVETLRNLASELKFGNDVKIWVRDLRNSETLYEDFSLFLKENKIIVDKVVHAAGAIKILPFRLFKLSDTLNIFNVNLFSIIEIIRVLSTSPYRVNLKSIVVISAFFSKFGDKGNAIYSSSKGALNSLIKGLAVEFPHVRVNALILGAVKTKMTAHLFDDADLSRFSRYLLGVGNVDNVVDAVDFLMKDNLWMTGQELLLDGGASIN